MQVYTITNSQGSIASFISRGATWCDMIVKDKNGILGDILLGYTAPEAYLQNDNPYYSAVCGRYANRIFKGQFSIEDTKYQLTTNNNGNCLHGGAQGFNSKNWDVEKISSSKIKFSYVSEDGEEGFPGTLKVNVTYTLSEENEMIIQYEATTDSCCPVNLTNHAYFNLSAGGDPTIGNHFLHIDAVSYLEMFENIPSGKLIGTTNTRFDFTEMKKLSPHIQPLEEGYDDCFILQKRNPPLTVPDAILWHPTSGRMLEMYTTEPSIQLYTTNSISTNMQHNKYAILPHAGLCLEAQAYPDAPNHAHFPDTLLQPGEQYKQTTIYKFSIKE